MMELGVVILAFLPYRLEGIEPVTPETLCQLVAEARAGTRRQAVVSALFVRGRESTFLYDPSCQGAKPLTWVDLQLDTKANKKALDRIVKRDGRARVILTGEIWGPRPPDPELPEPFRFPLGWGHLGRYPTRFLTKAIAKPEAVEADVDWFRR